MKKVLKSILPKYLIVMIKGIIDSHWSCYQPFKGVIKNLNELPSKEKYNEYFFTDVTIRHLSANIKMKY